MRRPAGNDLRIAMSLGGRERLMLTKEQRSRHLYVMGSTWELSEPVKKSSAGDRQAVVNMRSLPHEQRAFAVS
jgi:hypothetical protein